MTHPLDPAPADGPTHDRVLYRGRTHPKVLVRPTAATLILVCLHILLVRWYPDRLGWDPIDTWGQPVLHGVLAALDLRYVIFPILRWRNAHFEITDRLIKMRWGVLYKNSREIHLDRITQINEERGILDRLVGCGTIVVYDAANAAAIRFDDVARFYHVRAIIDGARHLAHARPHLPPGQ